MVPGPCHCLQPGLFPDIFYNVEVRDNTGFEEPLVVNCREENDVDLELSGRLYDKVDGLEKADVLNNIRFREERGLDTTELRERLRVLIELEEEQKQKS